MDGDLNSPFFHSCTRQSLFNLIYIIAGNIIVNDSMFFPVLVALDGVIFYLKWDKGSTWIGYWSKWKSWNEGSEGMNERRSERYATEINSIQLHDSIVMASPWDSINYITVFYISTLRYVALRYVTLHYVTLRYITLHYITQHFN